MSSNKTDDVVSEYLREIEARLGSLPLLQRRELLADLEAHIATERGERNVQSEGEVLEILERLGSPEVVAAAAYEEAGSQPQPPVAPPVFTRVAARPRRLGWIIAAVAAGALILMMLVLFAAFFSVGSSSSVVGPVSVDEPVPVPRISATR